MFFLCLLCSNWQSHCKIDEIHDDRNVFTLCRVLILPGNEIFQHNLSQSFDPVAPLLLVFFHSVWEKLWLLTASSHLRIEKGEKPFIFFSSRGQEGGTGARGDVQQLDATSLEIQKTAHVIPGSMSLPGQGRLCCSLELLGDKRLPGARSSHMEILPWSWIPLHQNGLWHRREGATKEVAVGKASMRGTSSFTAPTSSGGTTFPHVWGYTYYSS